MKIKIFLLFVICVILGILISEQNKLIKIPKEERIMAENVEQVVKGKIAVVHNGNSFDFENGTKIRLYGIDAPEIGQTCILTTEVPGKNGEVKTKDELIRCGENAKNKLTELVGSGEIDCTIMGVDAYGRSVGECGFERYNSKTKRTDKININKEMVLSGNAVAFSQISDKYIEDEHIARAENRGIWATTFDVPSVYRKKNEK